MAKKSAWLKIRRSDYERMAQDIQDMRDAHSFERCRVCKRLGPEGYCCHNCGWNGTEEHADELRATASRAQGDAK